MKRLFILLVILKSAALAQQVQPVSASISGTLTGEDGSAIVGGEIRLHLVPRSGSRLAPPRTDWMAATLTGGAFQFQGLPEGTYTVCPRVPNTTWLSPCEWNFTTPTATISISTPNAIVPITLKRGVAVPIRIDDAGQLLAANEGKTPSAGLLVNLYGPGLFFRLVPLVSKDSGGRNYQILVPFNTSLTLMVHPSFYRLTDAKGVALSQSATTKIPLSFPPGQPVQPIKFTISGAAH